MFFDWFAEIPQGPEPEIDIWGGKPFDHKAGEHFLHIDAVAVLQNPDYDYTLVSESPGTRIPADIYAPIRGKPRRFSVEIRPDYSIRDLGLGLDLVEEREPLRVSIFLLKK